MGAVSIDFNGIFSEKKRRLLKINNLEGKNDEDGLRQRVSYLQRKTLGYCKKKVNFTGVLWINLYDYNYRCHHKSLRLPLTQPGVSRFQKKWTHRTPAMAMGLTQEALTWRFLFVAPIPVTR